MTAWSHEVIERVTNEKENEKEIEIVNRPRMTRISTLSYIRANVRNTQHKRKEIQDKGYPLPTQQKGTKPKANSKRPSLSSFTISPAQHSQVYLLLRNSQFPTLLHRYSPTTHSSAQSQKIPLVPLSSISSSGGSGRVQASHARFYHFLPCSA